MSPCDLQVQSGAVRKRSHVLVRLRHVVLDSRRELSPFLDLALNVSEVPPDASYRAVYAEVADRLQRALTSALDSLRT